MADEQKGTTVTDSALDKASEETTETTEVTPSQEPEAGVSETQQIEEAEKAKEEQRERSALGRKFKLLEERLVKSEERNEKLVERLDSLLQNQLLNQEKPLFEGDDFLTVSKLPQVLEQWESKKAQKQNEVLKKYEEKYLDMFARLGAEEKLTDDEFMQIEEIMRKSFNASYSNYADPVADSERNFLKALRAFEKDKATKKLVNLKGDTPKGTGIGTGTKMEAKTAKAPELDEFAKDFVNRFKIPEEKVANILEGETPMRLKRRT